MALYGKLELANMKRLHNMGYSLGAFFISSYKEGLKEEENIERKDQLLKMIRSKHFSYVPIFAGNFDNKVINEGRVCYYVINRKAACNDTNQLMTDEDFLETIKEFCKAYDKDEIITLHHGEVRVYKKDFKDYSLLHWGVFFWELVNMASNTKEELFRATKIEYFVRTFLTMSGLQSTGYGGERHLWEEEFPHGKNNSFESEVR